LKDPKPILEPPDPAEDYFRRVRRGLITPGETEGEFEANGWPPLALTPDSEKFDPMGEIWWTLGMAAAWIIWRTPHAVRRTWWTYRRREVRAWIGPYLIEVLAEEDPDESGKLPH
jgi:hypothetical protein